MSNNSDDYDHLSPAGKAFRDASDNFRATQMADDTTDAAQMVAALEGIFTMLGQIAFQLEEISDRLRR